MKTLLKKLYRDIIFRSFLRILSDSNYFGLFIAGILLIINSICTYYIATGFWYSLLVFAIGLIIGFIIFMGICELLFNEYNAEFPLCEYFKKKLDEIDNELNPPNLKVDVKDTV